MITFKDIHIGDTVILKNGKTGIVLKLVSVPYINNFGLNNNIDSGKIKDFTYNETRDIYKLYNTVTVYLKGYGTILNCDLNNIVKVFTDDSNYLSNRKPNKLLDYIRSIKYRLFKK
jgi:hypothetical protein